MVTSGQLYPLTPCFCTAVGALAEAVAQPKEPAATAATAAPAGPPLSRLGSRSASAVSLPVSAHNSPHEQALGRARAMTEGATQHSEANSHLRPPSLQLLQQQDSIEGLLSSNSRGLGSSRLNSTHSATAAARLARQASSRLAAGQAAAVDDQYGHQQQQEQQQQSDLAVQLAAANAELASALATARQVLADLVLGSDPEPSSAAEVQGQLSGLSLEEALSEVVYQVGWYNRQPTTYPCFRRFAVLVHANSSYRCGRIIYSAGAARMTPIC